MTKTILALLLLAAPASAQGIQLAPGERLVAVDGRAVPQQHAPHQRLVGGTSLAQRKANILAQRGTTFHPGGGFGAGRAEGVGMGSSREAAIRNCCFWGKRTPIDIGTATNGRRWFACVIYR